jgi:hypothetical protein
MKKYKYEEADKSDHRQMTNKKYSPDRATDVTEDKYDKRMSRRLSIEEFIKKYKLSNDVGKE